MLLLAVIGHIQTAVRSCRVDGELLQRAEQLQQKLQALQAVVASAEAGAGRSVFLYMSCRWCCCSHGFFLPSICNVECQKPLKLVAVPPVLTLFSTTCRYLTDCIPEDFIIQKDCGWQPKVYLHLYVCLLQVRVGGWRSDSSHSGRRVGATGQRQPMQPNCAGPPQPHVGAWGPAVLE